MAIGFMSFGGMLTGGDEEEAPAETTIVISVEQQNDIANNTKVIE
jgi:Na+-transporting NADH:ubiquinone oxidoreductase subunit E